MAEHALLSASKASQWGLCTGSLFLTKDLPNTSSKYADEGTAAHELASRALSDGKFYTRSYMGQTFKVGDTTYTFDEAMCEHVQSYVDAVRDFVGDDGTLLVEQRVYYNEDLSAPRELAFGTADAVILRGEEIIVCDLKYGMGVEVDATNNEQLMLYALGALHEYGLLGDFKSVRLVIVQPRIKSLSEWSCPPVWLEEFKRQALQRAQEALAQYEGRAKPVLTPGEKQCRFCKAKATCPALAGQVKELIASAPPSEATADEFAQFNVQEDTPAEREYTPAELDMVEDWIKAQRANIERRLFAGDELQHWKLVEGKRGNRAWTDEKQVELAFKAMRLKVDEMYDMKLISPTKAEKLLKDAPRKWPKVLPFITRSDGKPSVAPLSDKRPALTLSVPTNELDGFPPADDLSDLIS